MFESNFVIEPSESLLTGDDESRKALAQALLENKELIRRCVEKIESLKALLRQSRENLTFNNELLMLRNHYAAFILLPHISDSNPPEQGDSPEKDEHGE